MARRVNSIMRDMMSVIPEGALDEELNEDNSRMVFSVFKTLFKMKNGIYHIVKEYK